jgi:hypothetical protein
MSSDPTRRAVAAVACLLVSLAAARSAEPRPADPPVTALWTAVPIREWSARVTALAGRPVVVDRRVDPDTLVTRDCRGEPLTEVLAAVAREAGAVAEPLRSWIRIAPTGSAGRVAGGERDRAAELAKLPATARAALAARRPWSWADGARPRDLVSAAAAEAGVAVSGLDAVPHDHIAAAALPALPLAERLDLVLAHYDRRVAWTAGADGTLTGHVVPLGDAEAPATTVVVPNAPRQPPRRPARPGAKPAGGDRFTLTLEAPLDQALAAVGPRLGLEPAIDRDSLSARGILPGEIVRARVTDATRDQLLDAIVTPLGLRWRIDGSRLIVDAPPP